jgi:hypothetical protein
MLSAMPEAHGRNRHGGALKLHRGATFGEVSIAAVEPETATKLPNVANGTAIAINYLRLGVPADLPCKTTRGGARNRADRTSEELRTAQIANLKAAERHARKIGLPITRMITIHWEAAGVPANGMAKATGRFLDLLSKALARLGSKTAWIWVHESGPGKGGHCHILVHVPAELVEKITRLQRGWLRIITLRTYRARVIYSAPIGGRLGLERGNPDLHLANCEAALAYVLKGASAEAALAFGLDRLEPGGLIIGKRCGTSANIGAKARSKGA